MTTRKEALEAAMEEEFSVVAEALNAVGMPVLNGWESDDEVARAITRSGFAISAATLEVARALRELKDELKEIPFTDG
jgi:hypothetical protein